MAKKQDRDREIPCYSVETNGCEVIFVSADDDAAVLVSRSEARAQGSSTIRTWIDGDIVSSRLFTAMEDGTVDMEDV